MNKCIHCNGKCVKAGKQSNGTQKLRCKSCKKYQLVSYHYKACHPGTCGSVSSLIIEGVGIRGASRILRISSTTVIRIIKKVSSKILKPIRNIAGKVIEMDELWTYVKKKSNEIWITYALERSTKEVIDFEVGARAKQTIRRITDEIVTGSVKRICTDGLTVYKTLVPKNLHRTGSFNTQRIERFNLNLRTHLKRLSRKTICFSKSKEMLEACLRIYFWGHDRRRIEAI